MLSSLVSGVMKSSAELLDPPAPSSPKELPRERLAGLCLAAAGSRPPLPGQHSSRRPSLSKTLKSIMEAPSNSRWIMRAPLVLQTRAISPQPRVMKTLPGAMTSTSASVAGAWQLVCCNQSLKGPLGGISKAKEGGRRIQDRGGMAAWSTNSREEPSAWIPGGTTRTAVTRQRRRLRHPWGSA